MVHFSHREKEVESGPSSCLNRRLVFLRNMAVMASERSMIEYRISFGRSSSGDGRGGITGAIALIKGDSGQ